MMKSQRLIWGGAVCIVGATIVGIVALNRTHSHPQFPGSAYYENFPQGFNRSLQIVRDNIHARPNDLDQVRKLARLYHANRLYDEALACYGVIAATSPGLLAHDHYYLADIAQNRGDLDMAQKELRATLRAEPHYRPARIALAQALFKSGREEEAATEYSAILSAETNEPQASLGLARIDLQRGNEDSAVSRLEQLVSAHPESTSGAALLAQLLNRRGKTDRAAMMTQRSRQSPEPIPLDPWMDALLADCFDVQRLTLKFEEYLQTGQMDQATPFLSRVEELDPKSWIPQLLKGWTQARDNHQAQAVIEYNQALIKGGDPEKICPLLVSSLITLGKLSEAATLMAGCYAKTPDSIPILTLYADVAVRQRDDKTARILLTRLLQKEPYLFTPNMSLSKILWASGERDEAVKCLQRVANVFSNDVPSRALLGEYYLEKSDPLSAIGPLEQAIAQPPIAQKGASERLSSMLDTAYLQAGNREAEGGHFSQAVAYYDKGIHLVPTDLNACAAKANACVQLKQLPAAKDALSKILSLQPDNPTVRLSLGDVVYQEGDFAQARQHWERALQLTPAGDTELRNALQERLSGRITAETFK